MNPEILCLLWFVILNVLLIGYAILDGFDLGVGIVHPFAAKTDTERRLVMNSIGPLWMVMKCGWSPLAERSSPCFPMPMPQYSVPFIFLLWCCSLPLSLV